ncbi:hypothetical protein ACFLYT_00630 [Nanoarchaeota archaeon]
MKWIEKGKEMEIAYSTKVQEKLAKTLEETLIWRKRMYSAMNSIKWIMIVFVILGLLFFFYIDSRNALTAVGQKFFCGA